MTNNDCQNRMKWFHEARFGIYVHFGLYSLLGRGEWTMYSERIPASEYARLADDFHPDPGCAEEWVAAAKAAGAKYMVLTTRHHEGFCLFDSKFSDFTSVKHGCKRDIVAEYVTAARAAGLKVGLYYSLLDWRFPGYFEPAMFPENKTLLVEYVHSQVCELMTNYGQIDLLEYDGGWMANYPSDSPEERADFWHARELNAMVRRLQPSIIINNRSGLDEDIDTPEQVVAASAAGRAWESCMCIGDSCCWGYTRFNPNWKSREQLIQHLVYAATGEGNFLLNIGPQPNGRLRSEELDRLSEIGRWLEKNGDAIYGSQRCDLIGACTPNSVDLNLQGPWSRNGNTGYWFCFRWPGRQATAVRVATRPLRVTIPCVGEKEYQFTWNEVSQKMIVSGLPSIPPDGKCTVIKVEFDSIPRCGIETDKSAWLNS